MKNRFFSNLRREIDNTQTFEVTRIKIDWLSPDALGLPNNFLDNQNRNDFSPAERRKFFVELI